MGRTVQQGAHRKTSAFLLAFHIPPTRKKGVTACDNSERLPDSPAAPVKVYTRKAMIMHDRYYDKWNLFPREETRKSILHIEHPRLLFQAVLL